MQILINEISDHGIKRVKVACGLAEKIPLYRFVPDYILRCAGHLVDARQGEMDGKLITDLDFPMLGPVWFRQGDGKWKNFFVVHRSYGRSVSDCVRLGVDGWLRITKDYALCGYVSALPVEIESGRETHGVPIFAADWMMKDCVAVGNF